MDTMAASDQPKHQTIDSADEFQAAQPETQAQDDTSTFLFSQQPWNSNALISYNTNLQPGPEIAGIGVSPAITQTDSIVDDLGNASYLRNSSHAISSRLSQASSRAYSLTGIGFESNIKEPRENGFSQLEGGGIPDVGNETLGESIRAAYQVSQSKGKHLFLPNDAFDAIVTWERVRHELGEVRPELSHPNGSIFLPEDLDRLANKVWEITSPPSPSKTKNKKETTRRKIFAILALMNKFRDIVDFIEEDIYDNDLPFILSDGTRLGSKQLNRKREEDKEPIQLFNRWDTFELEYFHQFQWNLTTPYFHLSSDNKGKPQHFILEKDTILPFIEDEEVGEHREGGYSEVWRVKIHPAHHNWCKHPASTEDNPWYAIKRLRVNNFKAFNEESSSLKRFSETDHEHLIKLLATFFWCDQYYLLFPCADGNLLDFWKEHPNPPDSKENPLMAQWLSKQCLGLVSGLSLIHNAVNEKSVSGKLIHGRHGDLKPENILWFKNHTDNHTDKGSFGTLKISDFGLARFHRTQSNPLFERVPVSRTYRAPEYEAAEMVSSSYDIWTLGCLLLEFVTWYLLGWKEVEEFANKRVADEDRDDKRKFKEDVFFHFVVLIDSNGQTESGARAKVSVVKEFQLLYKNGDCSDFIIDLLEFIERRLLRISPRNRAPCEHIFQKFEELHRDCMKDNKYCTERVKTPPKRTGTDLSQISASTLKSAEFDQQPPKDQQNGSSETESQPNFNVPSHPIAASTGKTPGSIKPLPSKTPSVDGLQNFRRQSLSKKVHFKGQLSEGVEHEHEGIMQYQGENYDAITLNNIKMFTASLPDISQIQTPMANQDHLAPTEIEPTEPLTFEERTVASLTHDPGEQLNHSATNGGPVGSHNANAEKISTPFSPIGSHSPTNIDGNTSPAAILEANRTTEQSTRKRCLKRFKRPFEYLLRFVSKSRR